MLRPNSWPTFPVLMHKPPHQLMGDQPAVWKPKGLPLSLHKVFSCALPNLRPPPLGLSGASPLSPRSPGRDRAAERRRGAGFALPEGAKGGLRASRGARVSQKPDHPRGPTPGDPREGGPGGWQSTRPRWAAGTGSRFPGGGSASLGRGLPGGRAGTPAEGPRARGLPALQSWDRTYLRSWRSRRWHSGDRRSRSESSLASPSHAVSRGRPRSVGLSGRFGAQFANWRPRPQDARL